ncbi:MAG: hypothetical protein DYH04_15750 [Nitrospira sp. NTP2]|nr:hypothetical protein [Nitrospira sp. NTP2]RIK56403.1 MAG: hypothetical protein DCC63_17420 [Nitrospira sp.]
MKADLARRMSRPLAALGGHSQSRHLHPLTVNHEQDEPHKSVIVRRESEEIFCQRTAYPNGKSESWWKDGGGGEI